MATNLLMFTSSYDNTSSSGAAPSVFPLNLVFLHFIQCSSGFA